MSGTKSKQLRSTRRVKTGVCREQLKTSKSERNSDTHNKRHKCDYCEKAFQRMRSLVLHIRKHTGEKPFECQSCPNKFADKSALVMHTRTHTGEKPYKCEYCGKEFSQSSSLTSHTRTHTGEKPFECRICDYSGAVQANLIRHERTHAEEKPFKCQFCSFATKFPSNLKVHEQGHAADMQVVRKKPKYKCLLCPKVYPFLQSLRYHEKTHIGEKQHRCTFCDYSAIQRGDVVSHERSKHAAKNEKSGRREIFSAIPEQPVSPNKQKPVPGVRNQCRACGTSATSDADLALHMSALHNLPAVSLRRMKRIMLP